MCKVPIFKTEITPLMNSSARFKFNILNKFKRNHGSPLGSCITDGKGKSHNKRRGGAQSQKPLVCKDKLCNRKVTIVKEGSGQSPSPYLDYGSIKNVKQKKKQK